MASGRQGELGRRVLVGVEPPRAGKADLRLQDAVNPDPDLPIVPGTRGTEGRGVRTGLLDLDRVDQPLRGLDERDYVAGAAGLDVDVVVTVSAALVSRGSVVPGPALCTRVIVLGLDPSRDRGGGPAEWFEPALRRDRGRVRGRGARGAVRAVGKGVGGRSINGIQGRRTVTTGCHGLRLGERDTAHARRREDRDQDDDHDHGGHDGSMFQFHAIRLRHSDTVRGR